jgi:peptidoglycan hydrolase-like protein with peptidoglycan-binding domain
MLNKAGFNAGKVDGIFGKNTRNALIRFQRAKGIAVDGVAGIQTYNALINQLSAQAKKKAQKSTSSNQWTGQTLRIGSRGQAVKDLQSKLSKLGYNVGAIDGIYGKQTAAAVKSFQRTYGLSQDGIAGKNTYSAMNQALQRRNTYNKTTVIENRYKALENKVHNKNSTWNEVSKSLKDIAKMGYDFIIGDDIKTLIDPKANTVDKVIAGLSFLPPGKVIKGALKLVKAGSKVTVKLNKELTVIDGIRKTSKYEDVTGPRSRVTNIETGLKKNEFERNLINDGWKRSIAGGGKVTIFEKDGARYVLRDNAKSTGGPTADFYPPGSKKFTMKIRLKK